MSEFETKVVVVPSVRKDGVKVRVTILPADEPGKPGTVVDIRKAPEPAPKKKRK